VTILKTPPGSDKWDPARVQIDCQSASPRKSSQWPRPRSSTTSLAGDLGSAYLARGLLSQLRLSSRRVPMVLVLRGVRRRCPPPPWASWRRRQWTRRADGQLARCRPRRRLVPRRL